MSGVGRIQVQKGRRLVWYSKAPDETYWHDHWAEKVRPEYYQGADRIALHEDELGKVLVETFDPHGLLLEAGCGAGWYVAALQSAGYQVDGIDFSRRLVSLIISVEPNLPIRQADATQMDAPDGSYASYLSIGVMEHRFDGPEPFLREAFRLIRPGGKAVITVPAFGPLRRVKARFGAYRSEVPQDVAFFQYGFTRSEFSELVSAEGFRVDHAGYFGASRMLREESSGYRWLIKRKGGDRLVRAPLAHLLAGRDGHMLIIIATKPAEP